MPVYFIQCRETGLIKIGHTDSTSIRRAIQLTGVRGGTSITATILGELSGGRDRERALHRRFAADLAGGWPSGGPVGRECFRPSEALLAFIARLPPRKCVGVGVTKRHYRHRAGVPSVAQKGAA